jgi:hypothetical protein
MTITWVMGKKIGLMVHEYIKGIENFLTTLLS